MARAAAVFALLTALALTHRGAVILAFAVVATLAARGAGHPAFLRAAGCLAAALAVWGAVKALYRPDSYFADMFRRAALNFFDVAIFRVDVVLLLAGTLAAYAVVYVLWRRAAPERALGAATALVAAALAGYFLASTIACMPATAITCARPSSSPPRFSARSPQPSRCRVTGGAQVHRSAGL